MAVSNEQIAALERNSDTCRRELYVNADKTMLNGAKERLDKNRGKKEGISRQVFQIKSEDQTAAQKAEQRQLATKHRKQGTGCQKPETHTK